MTITKEEIESRLKVLKENVAAIQNQILKFNADMNATQGAIQDCEFWLSKFPDVAEQPTLAVPPDGTSN